jgi:hypothetical protein
MTDSVLVCENHPSRETNLRCNRCGKPICGECAVQTPVGYRCKECIRGQQKVFETASNVDVPTAFVVSAVCVGVAVAILNYLWIWGLIVAPIVGGVIAEVVRWAVRRRRSRRMYQATVTGGILGAAIYLAIQVIPFLRWMLFTGGDSNLAEFGGSLISFVWPVAYSVLIISALYYRLRGIRL